MEAFASSGRLVHERETGGMEDDGRCWCCCGGGRAGSARARLPFQGERRLQRAGHLFAVACVLLVSVAVASLVAFALGARARQPRKQPPIDSAGYAQQQRFEEWKTPRAMLTAPTGTKVDGKYLQWENNTGRAFCQGGFSYSNGSLVVPRNGTYRVFLQITYESNSDCLLLNKLYYTSSEYKEDRCLLSSVDTVSCHNDLGARWSKSLYTSGLFDLNTNGRLRVTSSCPNLITRNEHQVFFGAELLPP